MLQRPFPPWLVKLASKRMAVASTVGVILIAVGVLSLLLGRTPGEPIKWGALAWVVAVATLVAGLVRQSLSLISATQKLSRLNAELAQTNTALNESVAASRAMRQELTRQKMLAENLLAVARATGQRPVLEATLQNTLSICMALTGATHGALFLMDANGRVTRHLLARQDVPPQETREIVGKAMTEGLAGWAMQYRQVARIADTTHDPRWVTLPGENSSIRSAMAIPLISRDAIVGVVTLMHSSPQHFGDEHERLLADAADQVALALDNARIFDTLTRLTDRLSLLYETSQMAAQLDLDPAVAQVVRAVRASTGWPTIAAFFLDENQTPTLQASVGNSAQAIQEHKWPSGEGLMARAISIALPLRNCDGASAMVAPIRIGQRVLGMLGVYNAEPDCYTNEDLELLSSVADTLAMAVAYAELSKR